MDSCSVHESARPRPLRTIRATTFPHGPSTGGSWEANLGIGLVLLSVTDLSVTQKSRVPRSFTHAFAGHLLSASSMVGPGKQ